MTRLTTKLEIKSWDEQPYRELDDGRKFTKADVTLAGTGDGIEAGSFESIMFYRTDGTADYVSVMQLSGSLDGKSGDFVLRGDGSFDGTTAQGEMEIVPGSGTGAFAGITGTATSASTHDDYPFMPLEITYALG
ncbi:MAG TPA: DUF3224 domain-containing protein [Micromonosporaceae bacterium]|nr:DUF3224 domain-containing protein [Micromonosporaceae bacterium]